MLKTEDCYFNSTKTPASSGAVILYRAEEKSKSYRLSIAVCSLMLFGLASIFQLNFVYSQESGNSPITAPVSSPVTSPELSPSPTPYPSISPEPTSAPSPSQNNGGGNSGGGGSGGPASCNDAKPAKAPVLTQAVVSGPNAVSLNWTKALDPVTYYLIAYGLKPGAKQYGNPNIGGRDTTSFTVKGLSTGATYYFKVRAGNNCAPGDFSNELAIKVVKGAQFSSPAQGFVPNVLGGKKVNQTISNRIINKVDQKPATSYKSKNQKAPLIPKNSFFSILQNFLNNLFN